MDTKGERGGDVSQIIFRRALREYGGPVGWVEGGVGPDQVEVIPLEGGEGGDGTSCPVVGVGPPGLVGTVAHGQGRLVAAVAGRHGGDGREEVTGFGTGIRGR